MSAEPLALHRPGCGWRRSTSDRLREALLKLSDHRGQLLSHSEKAWASITFEGARHTVELIFDGAEAVEAGEAFIDALTEHEFAIPGQLVAEATVVAVDHVLMPCLRLAVICELLLLKDG